MNTVILPTGYFPSIAWFFLADAHETAVIEQHEHFPKQTWRNRCTVAGTGRRHDLVVPLSGRRDKMPVKDILVDHSSGWQKTHWKTLEACYRKTPWFEFYEDDLFPLFEKKEKYLTDQNDRILDTLFSMTGIQKSIRKTERYEKTIEGMDGRNLFNKKTVFSKWVIPPYGTGTSGKEGLVGNLCILDLLFYEGRNAMEVIRSVSLKRETS